jgi:hypothetical protein
MRRHGVEELFIATDYYDGPRRGTASYHGQLCDESGVVLR